MERGAAAEVAAAAQLGGAHFAVPLAAGGALFRWSSKLIVPVIVGSAARIGLLVGGG